MMQQPSFQTTWLPLGLTAIALVVLNLGLYVVLSSQPQPLDVSLTFPYFEDFASDDTTYEVLGGDWDIRDETLVQLSASGFDLMSIVPLQIEPEQPYQFDTTVRYLGGTMGGGVIFNAQQTTSSQQSHMTRFNVDEGQLWLIYGYFGDDSNFIGQGAVPTGIEPDDAAPHQFSVQVNTESYTLLIDGTPLATDIPLNYQGGSIGFIAATSQVAFDDVAVDVLGESAPVLVENPPVPQETTVTDPAVDPANQNLLFSDSFDDAGGTGESLWQPISGQWVFRDGVMQQTQTEGFDLTTIYQEPVTYPMTLEATYTHTQGVGGGMLFNLPQSTLKNGGHMVRYFDDGSTLAWGYFDETGQFIGQGNVGVTPPQQTTQTLQIVADDTAYNIYLNGTEIIIGVPVIEAASPGYIGVTASQSLVAFDEVQVFAGSGIPIDDGVDESTENAGARIDAAAATGNWVVESTTITQLSTENTDYIAGTGLAGEQFTISADITLPADNPDAGAGIAFHMAGRDDRTLGHMVRFGNGGQELFWGRYDADGVFAGEGGVPFDLEPGIAHTLLLAVHEDDFDILVDGEMVVEALPLRHSGGWIGLVSFGGPVIFDNVNLQFGQ